MLWSEITGLVAVIGAFIGAIALWKPIKKRIEAGTETKIEEIREKTALRAQLNNHLKHLDEVAAANAQELVFIRKELADQGKRLAEVIGYLKKNGYID